MGLLLPAPPPKNDVGLDGTWVAAVGDSDAESRTDRERLPQAMVRSSFFVFDFYFCFKTQLRGTI